MNSNIHPERKNGSQRDVADEVERCTDEEKRGQGRDEPDDAKNGYE